MTFAVNRAARRTFYLERYSAFWLVPRVWQVGTIVTADEAQRILNRAMNTEPRERWMAEQADGWPDNAPWHAVVARPRGDPNADDTRWDVLRVYATGEQIRPEDKDPPNVLVVAGVIVIPKRKAGQGVRVIAREQQLLIDSVRAAHETLHGHLPTDSGHT